MNINESIRNKRRLVEKLRWYTFKITYISTTNYCRRQTLYQNNVEAFTFDLND